MAEMPLAEHDNVVKTFPADRTDRPFTISVLPRRSRRGWPIPNPHRPKAADEDVTVEGVAVTNDVSRCSFPTIGLGELVRNPFSRWVRGHSQPQDLAAIVMQYQQPVEQSEGDCRNHEQVDRRDAVGVIMKERLPPLGRWSPSPRHILCNGGLSDIDAELENLAMNPWCAPQWAGEPDLANELKDFQRGLRPAAARSRFPAPIRSEAGTMPADHRLRLNDRESVQHAGRANRYNPANTRRSMLVKVSRCGDLRRSTLS